MYVGRVDAGGGGDWLVMFSCRAKRYCLVMCRGSVISFEQIR